MGQFAEYALFLSSRHTDTVVERSIQIKVWVVGILIAISSGVFIFAQTSAQGCVMNVISTQIIQLSMYGGNATVPSGVENVEDDCVRVNSIVAAMSLGLSSVLAAVLGVLLSRLRTGVSARYEPHTHKLVLRFDRPVIAHNPQRMVLLYRHADGMAAVVPGRQCGDGGLALAFTTNIEESPTRMELVVCSGAMHPVGFPESDVCAGGQPIHVDVDIRRCDT